MFNIMDIIVFIIIFIGMYIGYKKGFVKSAINLLSFFIAIGVALMFYKPISVILTENTNIDDWVIDKILLSSNEEVENKNEYISGDIKSEEVLSGDNKKEDNYENIKNTLKQLPNSFIENFDFDKMKQNAKEEFAYQFSEIVMNLLSLIIIYIVVKLTLIVAAWVLNGIMQIPILKQLNEMLGLVLGCGIGFTQIYVAFAILTFVSSILDISGVINLIKASAFARILFENNILIKLLF